MRARIPGSIDEYIAGFTPDIQELLQLVRLTVRKAAPAPTETIKYAMPTFILNGDLVHFSAFKRHIGFYPVPKGIQKFDQLFEGYKTGKGSIQFPLNRPMPLDLITHVVQYRIKTMGVKSK